MAMLFDKYLKMIGHRLVAVSFGVSWCVCCFCGCAFAASPRVFTFESTLVAWRVYVEEGNIDFFAAMEEATYVVFFCGVQFIVVGFIALTLLSRNLLFVLLCLEVITLGFNLLFVLASFSTFGLFGFMVVFILLLVVGAESVLGLSLVMVLTKMRGELNFNRLELRG